MNKVHNLENKIAGLEAAREFLRSSILNHKDALSTYEAYMREQADHIAALEAENNALRAALMQIDHRAAETLPSERNKVTYWRYMARDMADIARAALEPQS